MSFQSILNIISLWALPFIIVLILTVGMFKKIPIYEVFTEGAKDGFKVAVNIIPYLVAIIVAISMLRASGAIEMLAHAMASFLAKFNIPADVLPVIFVRPLSGSAALGLFSDIATTAGTGGTNKTTGATISITDPNTLTGAQVYAPTDTATSGGTAEKIVFDHHDGGWGIASGNYSDNTKYDSVTQTAVCNSTKRPASGVGGTSTDGQVHADSSTPNTSTNGQQVAKGQIESYIAIYNAIANNPNGWVYAGSVDNSNSLQNDIALGNITIEQLQPDGSTSDVSTDSTGSPFTAVADSSATTVAEAEYNSEKDKIAYKESMLDIQSNNLDTERSSITTEITSVQALLKRNFDSFKVFDSNG